MIFYSRHQVIDIPVSETSREHKMRAIMCKLWTNFAKYGNPTPIEHNPLDVTWNPVEPSDQELNHMILCDQSHMIKNLNDDRIQFWTKIYEKHNGSLLDPYY